MYVFSRSFAIGAATPCAPGGKKSPRPPFAVPEPLPRAFPKRSFPRPLPPCPPAVGRQLSTQSALLKAGRGGQRCFHQTGPNPELCGTAIPFNNTAPQIGLILPLNYGVYSFSSIIREKKGQLSRAALFRPPPEFSPGAARASLSAARPLAPRAGRHIAAVPGGGFAKKPVAPCPRQARNTPRAIGGRRPGAQCAAPAVRRFRLSFPAGMNYPSIKGGFPPCSLHADCGGRIVRRSRPVLKLCRCCVTQA